MRQFFNFTFITTKLLFRSTEAVMWNIAFPVFLLIIYITVFSGMYGESISKAQAVADNLSKILAITIMSGGLFTLAISVTVMKEKGILRRYKVTPIRPLTIVTGLIARQYLFMMLILVLLFLMSIVIFHAELAGTVLDWFLSSTLGIFVFTSIGFIIAGVVRTNQAAAGLANLLFMPMLFLSGATIPSMLFPQWLIDLSKALPSTHMVNLLHDIMFKGEALSANMTEVWILMGFGVAAVAIASFLSRWN